MLIKMQIRDLNMKMSSENESKLFIKLTKKYGILNFILTNFYKFYFIILLKLMNIYFYLK